MASFITRKITALVLAGLMTFGACSCSAEGIENKSGSRLSIVTTVFPCYDWVREIAGSKISGIDLTMLLDNGTDMHSFQPAAKDIVKISSCDVFIYVGGESDEWVEDALKEAVNKDIRTVNLMDLLGDSVVEEETVEGMQAEDEEEGEDGPEYDEHVWLSLLNAQVLVTGIADAMAQADPENASLYENNAGTYNSKLGELDGRYRAAVKDSDKDTILFCDRFPFRYLTDELGLDYYAAFSGCSAEAEASFETVVFLSGKIDELGLSSVLVIDGSDQKIAKTVIENTGSKDMEILVMDSMQSTTTADSSNGVTYLSVMESNLEVLVKALG
ncbi:MAG: zinc ABC transporter substrate-binding protein [Clostridiales bacterium]|nr:zinc ABC transporter substrate-binding protein [Clostridiales bacterium]